MAFRLLMISQITRWMPPLAACHSSNPPRMSPMSAICRHKETRSSALQIFSESISCEAGAYGPKRAVLFPKGSLCSENEQLFPIANAGIFRLTRSISSYSGKACPFMSTTQTGRLSAAINCPMTT